MEDKPKAYSVRFTSINAFGVYRSEELWTGDQVTVTAHLHPTAQVKITNLHWTHLQTDPSFRTTH